MSAFSLVFDPHLPWWLLAAPGRRPRPLVGFGPLAPGAGGGLARGVPGPAAAGAGQPDPAPRGARAARRPGAAGQRPLAQPGPRRPPGAARGGRADCASGWPRCRGSSCARSTLDGEGRQGTRLFAGLREALAESDRERLGAVVALTDGQAHDAPADPAAFDSPAPLHVLLTGRPDESDRQLAVEQAPSFGVVGEPQALIAPGRRRRGARRPRATVPVTLRQDGKVVRQLEVRPGEPTQVPFTLDKAGTTVVEVEAAVRPGELTTSTTAPRSTSAACATACACWWSPASPIRACASGATCSRPTPRSTSSTSPSCARPRSRTARRSASWR